MEYKSQNTKFIYFRSIKPIFPLSPLFHLRRRTFEKKNHLKEKKKKKKSQVISPFNSRYIIYDLLHQEDQTKRISRLQPQEGKAGNLERKKETHIRFWQKNGGNQYMIHIEKGKVQ